MEKQAALIHADEASFRQDSTLHRTWAKRGHQPRVPVTGARKSAKVLGCVETYSARFLYRTAGTFNGSTYVEFLDRVRHQYGKTYIIWIADNASYHKGPEARGWLEDHAGNFECHFLPPYSPEFNAAEPIWKHTRRYGTHNRYFDDPDALFSTLTSMFRSIQRNSDQINGILIPFR